MHAEPRAPILGRRRSPSVAAAALITEGSLRANGGLSPGAYRSGDRVGGAARVANAGAARGAWPGSRSARSLCAAAFDAGWAATAMVIVELYTVALPG